MKVVHFGPNTISEKVKNNESITSEILELETILKHFITLDDLNKAIQEF